MKVEREKLNLNFEELEKVWEEQRSVRRANLQQLQSDFFASLDAQYESVFLTFKMLFAESYCSDCFDENISASFSFPQFNGRELEAILGKEQIGEWIKRWSARLKKKTDYIKVSPNGRLYWERGCDDVHIGIVQVSTYKDIFSGDLKKLKPWDRAVAEAVNAKEAELFYAVYDEVRKRLTEELKPQIVEMAKTLNPFQTYCTEVGFFRCSSDIVDAVGDEVSKQLEPFSVAYELRRKRDGYALYFEIWFRW